MKEEPIEQFEHEGVTVKIYQDTDAEGPDTWGDDNAFLVHYHWDFTIKRDKIITEDDARDFYQGNKSESLRELQKKYHFFTVAAYVHSGVSLSLGEGAHFPDQRWDVSHMGLYLCAKSEWRLRKKAEKYARAAIETWNQYLSGDVYGYVVEDKAGEHLDSCWGYYGMEEVKAEGLSVAKHWADKYRKLREKKLKAVIRNRVTLEKRAEVLA